MSDTVISVEGLSKRYLIQHQQAGDQSHRYVALRDVLTEKVRNLFRPSTLNPQPSTTSEEFWALKDVSFEVKQGERIGIIGRNGAGKSTLLKILSRITEPTQGRIRIKGRVASLLEVGTGFHPELTGRENIFLNGAILGMAREEIRKKFDEIVAFAEVEKFLDTPVKRYSSGMYVRLAFSVAAHHVPDILVVDEVLAVGDIVFQRRCMDYMHKLQASNVTILFVSHNMSAVRSLCNRAVLLDSGRVTLDGTPSEAVAAYEATSSLGISAWAKGRLQHSPEKCPIFLTRVEVLNSEGEEANIFDFGKPIRLRLHYRANEDVPEPNFYLAFIRSDNVATCSFSAWRDGLRKAAPVGEGVVEFLSPPLSLVSDQYQIYLAVWDPGFKTLLCAQDGPVFHIRDTLVDRHFGVCHQSGDWRSIAGSN